MSLLTESLTGNYIPHGNEEDAEVILVPAFSRSKEGPGNTNIALANFAIEAADRLGIEIIAQFSAANAVEELGRYDLLRKRIDPVNSRDGFYMNTNQFLQRSKEHIDPNKPALIVAQAFHAPRADREAQKMGLTTVLPEELPRDWDEDPIWQEYHCRNRIIWSVREPLVIAMNKLKGRI